MKKIVLLIFIISILVTGCGKKETLNGDVELDLSIAERENAIGKSDKDLTELSERKPSEVRNDTTGKWRKTTLSEPVDITEYALSYNKLFMEDDEVHFIVNFNYSTTTIINDYGGFLSIRTHEYVDKEEHDAKMLGGGMLLVEYEIYKDNGDITKVGD